MDIRCALHKYKQQKGWRRRLSSSDAMAKGYQAYRDDWASVEPILKLLSAIIARDICCDYCNYCKRIPQEKHLISRHVSGEK